MASVKEYDPESLIEAVTSLRESVDHPMHTMRTIQEIVLLKFGDHVSDAEAITLLGRLLERKLIKPSIDPSPINAAKPRRAGPPRRTKYVRVLEDGQ